jgi:hypothetical protein
VSAIDAREVRMHRRLTRVAAVCAVVVLLQLGIRADTGVSGDFARHLHSFDLSIRGSYTKTHPSDRFPLGYRYEGRFSASAPFCSTGTSVDLEYRASGNVIVELRRFTCSDGSGSITARMAICGWGDDHVPSWSEGSWRIVEGTGPYRELRGVGMWMSSPAAGAVGPSGTTERDRRWSNDLQAWEGQVAFDDEAPAVAFSEVGVSRVHGAPREYLVHVELSLRDQVPTTPVSFFVTARGRYVLAGKSDTTSSGKASIDLRVRPGRARALRLRIDAWDPVGNEAATGRALRLPR